jgi:hypothetical protein
MAYEVYKNDILPSGTLTDLAGNTRTHPYGGETRLGVDLFTGEELAEVNEVISISLTCDRCGRPTPRKGLKKQGGYLVCKDCYDKDCYDEEV